MNLTDKKSLGKTGLIVSRIAYGGIISMNEPQEDSDRYVSYAVDRGINYFDVAPAYGDAQTKLGNSLIPYRNHVYLACKSNERSGNLAELQLQESLKLLHTDYFDVYQLHAMTTNEDVEQAFAPNGVMDFLVRAKQGGLIRNIGFSAHNEEVALKLVERYPFDTILYPVNWALGLQKSMGEKVTCEARNRSMGILAIKSLAMRPWLDSEEKDYPKCWYKPVQDNEKLAITAMKYSLSRGADVLVPPGYFEYLKFMLEHLEECLRNPLTGTDCQYLEQELSKIEDRTIF